ncbi:MAG TPA: FG-GAP-like repeat-containing protein [Isosphaeraceae bacterium]|nr:FG-GAP-like repeat-containing protein [Isosphaeraceae bacterium]
MLLAALASLGYLVWGRSREPSLDGIRRAIAAQRWAEVEAGLRQWLRRHPRDGDAWEMLGGLLVDRGRTEEALTALRQVRARDEGWVHAQTLLGEIAVRQRRLAEAERIFRGVAERDRRDVKPLERLASLLVLERRTAEAREVLRRLFQVSRQPRHLVDSILVTQIESEVQDSSPELEEFLRQTPDDPWLGRAWGLFLHAHGRSAEARPYLEAAAVAFEDDPLGRFALAECRMALGDSQHDLALLGTPPSRAVDASRWWVLRSRLAEAWGRDEEALLGLQKAVAADPRNAEAHYRLGQVLIRRGDRPAARVHLDRAEALGVRDDRLKRELRRLLREPFDGDALLRIGQLCQEVGMTAEARDWFELALQRDPRHRSPPPGFDPARLAPWDDGPAVALSRPVLKASASPRPLEGTPQMAAQSDSGPRFEDIAPRSGVRFRYECGATPNLFIGDTMGGGVALFDYDGDGWLDIYFVNGCRLPFDRRSPPGPNRLYRNRGDGTFEDVTERAGVAGRGYGMGCAVGDFDNDGHDDVFVTGLGQTVLYRNRGDGTFEEVTERAGVSSSRWTTAAGFGDLDGDGDLDLVAVTYVEADPASAVECRDKSGRRIHCQPERFPAQLDHLFRNNGDGTFTDVSREAGIEVPEGKGLGLAIADLDGDGRLDLFVANDGTANFLFRNRGGLHFEEAGLTAGVAYDGTGQPTASMGVVAEDLNGDGRIDLFHTNFINQANTLRWNLGGGQFVDATLAANLAAPSRSKTGFGTVALDVDNDGTLDLFVGNGHTDDQPWLNTPMAQAAQLFLGREHGRFTPAGTEVSPYFVHPVVGRGVAAGDLDNDGRVDLVVVHRDAPAAVLRNRTRGGHWLGLRLRGTRSGRTPVGARVVCRAGRRSAVRWVTSGTSYLSASDSRLWFGLGSARMVEHLEVRWPSGMVQAWSNLPADRILDLQEGDNLAVHAVRPRVSSPSRGETDHR